MLRREKLILTVIVVEELASLCPWLPDTFRCAHRKESPRARRTALPSASASQSSPVRYPEPLGLLRNQYENLTNVRDDSCFGMPVRCRIYG
jgi:hypothetical protein